MNNIESILKKIADDANTAAQQKLDEANAEAQQILKDYQAQADQLRADALDSCPQRLRRTPAV